jgi:hypothetical protein
MALGSTPPVTEISTKNLPGDIGLPARKAGHLAPSVSPLCKKCESHDVLPFGPPWLALTFFLIRSSNKFNKLKFVLFEIEPL